MFQKSRNQLGVFGTVVSSLVFVMGMGSECYAVDVYDVRDYASFSAAVTAIGTTQTTLLIADGSYAVTANITVPTNLTLKFLQGGTLDISNGVTVKILGDVDAGLYKIFEWTGTGNVQFGDVNTVYPQWWGAIVDDAVDDTAALQAAINATGRPITAGPGGTMCSLPAGIYLISSSLKINHHWGGKIVGNGPNSVIQTAANSAIGIEIASTQPVYSVILENFMLKGTSSNDGGIKIGSSGFTNPVAWISMDRVGVRDFSKTNAYGMKLNSIQEGSFKDIFLYGNYNNVYRPTDGYLTSVSFYGMAGYNGHAINNGVLFDGTASDIRIRDIVFEGNGNEAIKFASTTAKSSVILDGLYFEANGTQTNAPVVHISGGTANAARSKLLMYNCRFFTNSDGNALNLNNVAYSTIMGNEGLTTLGVGTSGYVFKVHFIDNTDTSAVDVTAFYTALLAAAPYIYVDEWDTANGCRLMMGYGLNLKTTNSPILTLPPVYTTNANAKAGGLVVGQLYRSGGDPDVLHIVH